MMISREKKNMFVLCPSEIDEKFLVFQGKLMGIFNSEFVLKLLELELYSITIMSTI